MTSWRRPFVTTVVLILAVELILLGLGTGPEVMFVAAIGAFFGAARWGLAPLAEAAAVPKTHPVVAPLPPAGADERVKQLRRGIVFSKGIDSSSDRLYQSLVDLIDDQLLHAHGVDRLTDPDAAVLAIGPELLAFTHEPEAAGTLASTNRLDHIVTLIEQI